MLLPQLRGEISGLAVTRAGMSELREHLAHCFVIPSDARDLQFFAENLHRFSLDLSDRAPC